MCPNNSPVVEISNRGLRYGDGVFETMKWSSGKLVFAEDHFARLWNGLSILQFDIPDLFTPDYLTEQIEKLVEHEDLSYARVRLSVIRGNGGLFDLTNNQPFFLIEATALEQQHPGTHSGATVGIYHEARKMCDILSSIKHNNYLPYCLGAIFAKKNKLHDALVLNQFGRICDSTMANVFLMNNNTVVTPSLAEGCVAGIIRKNLIRVLPDLGYKVEETQITDQMIRNAEAAFLTNSILNLKAVSSIDNKQLNLEPALLLKKLVEEKTDLFC